MIRPVYTSLYYTPEPFVHKGILFLYDPAFIYGNCAAISIALSFGINSQAAFALCRGLNIKYKNGMTFSNCQILISVISRIKEIKVIYKANKTQTFFNFCKLNKKGIFILNMENHLSVLINGTIVDSYYYQDTDRISKLLGYWKLN